jgi:hypothetical protein
VIARTAMAANGAAATASHCKLRLHVLSSGGDGGGRDGGAGGRSAAEWLRTLLDGSPGGSSRGASEGSDGGGAHGGASGQRQASAALEFSDGCAVTLRLSVDSADESSKPGSLLLLLQCEDPGRLWTLRGAILGRLSRVNARVANEGAAEARTRAGGAASSSHELGALTSTTMSEAASLLPALRRLQLAHAQLHEQIHKCFELRRRFDAGSSSVSLQELSIEVEYQSRRFLELHQAVRGQLGCPSLGL